jgi:hypothetical protein
VGGTIRGHVIELINTTIVGSTASVSGGAILVIKSLNAASLLIANSSGANAQQKSCTET